jgi:hypothetical protein
MSIRIIKVKGKEYAQEVKYEWNPVKKVGKTKIIRHIGPVNPLISQKYRNTATVISSIIADKKKPKTKSSKTLKVKERQIKGDKPDVKQFIPDPELIAHVLETVVKSSVPLTRNQAYEIISQNLRDKDYDQYILKKRVGFSLTILDREGKLFRTGAGKPGDPYCYYAK